MTFNFKTFAKKEYAAKVQDYFSNFAILNIERDVVVVNLLMIDHILKV